MRDAATKEASAIDLSNCDKEPIHIPGCIQPHGVLLVLSEPDLRIVQVSASVATLLGKEPSALLGAPLNVLCDSQLMHTLRESLVLEQIDSINPLTVSVRGHEDRVLSFTGLVHRSDGLLLLELEPRDPRESESLTNLYQRAQKAIIRLNNAVSLRDLYQVTAEEMRNVSGFDRVMVYQFDPQWNGEVVAEAKADAVSSYYGLWFPASDIPKQARELYLHNWLRVISDVEYQPSPIVPSRNPITHSPLDLSASVLRSVSPIHIQYLKNMSVSATLTISLIVNNTLWGLIVCHHQTPRYLTYQVRMICEFIGQICSSLILAKEDRDNVGLRLNTKMLQSELLGYLDKEDNVVRGLTKHMSLLRKLVSAEGITITIDDTFVQEGRTPDRPETEALIEWLATQEDDVIATNALSELYPSALDLTGVASGLLAVTISRRDRAYLLWFRPEVIQTVKWGGNPQKPVEMSPDGRKLTPRASFDQWKETVRLRSLPWQRVEVEAATALRLKLIDRLINEVNDQKRIQAEALNYQTVLLAELSTPLIPINDDVVVMPIIGTVDTKRAQQVMETLLSGIVDRRAKTAILDITGMTVMDTQVANALVQAAQSVRLLGAQVILTGIRPEIAMTLISLGVDLRDIVTHSSLQAGINYATQELRASKHAGR
jgi:two-component system, chemotaxis family, sensor kinase Cph1